MIHDQHKGNNVLHYACKGQSIEIVKQLLAMKMDPESRNESGRTPLHMASSYGSWELVDVLLQCNVYVDSVTEYNDATPLVLAVASGKIISASLLLEAKANPNQQSYVCFSFLSYICNIKREKFEFLNWRRKMQTKMQFWNTNFTIIT